MNDILEKNLKILRERFPKEYENYDKNDKAAENITVDMHAGHNKQVPFVCAGNKSYRLDISHDNTEYLNLWHDGLINNAVINLYVFYGFGNGMYIRRILRNANENDKIFVYEPDAQILHAVFEAFDLSDVLSDSRVQLFIGDIIRFSAKLDKSVDYIMLKTRNSCIYPNYENIYGENAKEFASVVNKIYIDTIVSMNTVQTTARYWYENTLSNFIYMSKSKSLLDFTEKIDKDIPVIIVSSGPSLDKNIDLLPSARDRAIIAAVDSSLPALLKRNIIPDLFVSVDGQKKESHFADDRVGRIPVIGCIESISLIYGRDKSNYIMPKYIERFFLRNNINPFAYIMRGCVSGTALAIFLEMGIKTVILIGQDLAFTDDKDHADGIVNDIAEGNAVVDVYVDDIYGNKVRSSYQMSMYIKQFERDINNYSESTVIDATEGGARIEGTVIMTLSDAINKYCTSEINFARFESDIKPLMDENQQKMYWDYINNLEYEFDKIIDDLRKAVELYNMLLKEIKTSYNISRIKKLFDDVEKVSKRVSYDEALCYVELMNVEESRKLKDEINTLKDTEREELIAASQHGIDHSESMLNAAKQAREIYMKYKPAWNE